MKKEIYKWIRQITPIALMLIVFFSIIGVTHAQGALGSQWGRYLGDLPIFNTAPDTPGEDLAINFIKNGIRIARNVLGGVAVIFAILYGINLVLARGREEIITKQKQNFLWIFVGFLILMVSEQLAELFNPETSTTGQLVNYSFANDQLRDIANYIKWLLGSVIVLFMTISGIKMMIAGGDEEKVTTEKRHLAWGSIGILLVLLANNIVNAIYVINAETGAYEGVADTSKSINEIAGVIRLLLVFLGPVVLIFTIYAGFLYLTSYGDEERVNKAKRMIIGGVTGIIMVYGAFAIVNTFIRVPVCGNGTVEQTEECDDGNLTSGDGCSLECKIEAP